MTRAQLGITMGGRRKWRATLMSLCLVSAGIAGCAGNTTVEPQEEKSGFTTTVQIDPPVLNPPQRGTLTYGVEDNQGKPVTEFDAVSGTLMHSILVHRNLLYFQHTVADRLVEDEASVPVYFPESGTYHAFALYKPVQAPLQTFRTTITSGEETEESEIVEDQTNAKVAYGVRVELLRAPEAIKVGQPTQLVFHVTERGQAVTNLQPIFEAPGHLWIFDDRAENLVNLIGTSAQRALAQASPEAETTPASAQTPPARPEPERVPTFAAPIRDALRKIESEPRPTLLAVQQTALASILETPIAGSSVAYGPDVVFTHTFGEPGLHKMWLEIFYRGRVITVDYVVDVAE